MLSRSADRIIRAGYISPQAASFLARTSGLSDVERRAYIQMINGMVTDGVWSKLDALYIFATKDTTTAKTNLVSSNFTLTATTGATPPTFAADRGYTGQASQGLDTNLALDGAGLNYSLNSGSIGVYCLNNRVSNATTYAIGCDTASSGTQISLLQGGTTFLDINDLVFPSTANTGTQGLWHGSRTAASGAGCLVLYKNGAVFGSYSSASAAGVPAALNVYIFGRNHLGSMAGQSTDELSAAWIGGGFTAEQAGKFAVRLNKFMLAQRISVF
jgi:hypothetical protein